MEWNRSETLGLASVHCTLCHGLGMRPGRGNTEVPCHCVFRAIFRACFRRFRQSVEKEKHMSKCTMQFTGGRERSMTWGRKDEEYIADFLLMTKRGLSEGEYRVFRYHYLLGADWRLCTMKLKMDRGAFFHLIYRIESRLGRMFRETEPYGLYPLDEYFYGVSQGAEALEPPKEGPMPLRPPMAA